MPINTNLSTAPYFDDYDLENQYYRVLFKPGYAVQARELTQLQSILQNQVEQFGENIFKEGSIIKGCNFTQLKGLEFVKLVNPEDNPNFDVEEYISRRVVENINGVDTEIDYVFELTGSFNGIKATIISAARGFESRPPNLNTFFIAYLNTFDAVSPIRTFQPNETLTITRRKFKVGDVEPLDPEVTVGTINVTGQANAVGKSFGIRSGPGVIFQKGHFLFADEQILIVDKYSDQPDQLSVGYEVQETIIDAFEDNTLYDNANGFNNFNAPGADRLKLQPNLVVKSITDGDTDSEFFTLIRYKSGNAVTVRDVSQYNAIGEEMARRTFEESGNYVVKNFKITDARRGNDIKISVGPGTAYVKGHRIENLAGQAFTLDPVSNTEITENQFISFNYGNYIPLANTYNGYVELNWSPADLLDTLGNPKGSCYVINMTPEKVHVVGVRLNPGTTIKDIEKIDVPTGELVIGDPSNSIYPQLKETQKQAMIFDTGMFSLKEVTTTYLPIRKTYTATVTVGNQIIINCDADEDFNLEQDDVLVIETTGTKLNVLGTSVAVNGTQLIIDIDPGAAGSTAFVYCNLNLFNAKAEPYNKVEKTPYARINFSSSTNKYSLGFPDVFEIISITGDDGAEYKDSFILKNNQKDHFYDLSYIEGIPGRPAPPTGVITVQMKVFQINAPANAAYYFNISSYPVTLNPINIPLYVSSRGRKYNLRECFDFRPYVDIGAGMDYDASNPATAPIVSEAVGRNPVFTTSAALGPVTPARNGRALADIEHYLARVDSITVDSYGRFSVIKGLEERYPKPTKIQPDQLVLAHLELPGYPTLTSGEAVAQGKRKYGLKVRPKTIKGYTMKDIQRIESKVDNINYYISLSQLEADTRDLAVLDENGLNRFKNGFVVEPFNDLTFADIENNDFSAAIRFNKRTAMPRVKQFPIDLKFASSSNISIFPPTTNPNAATLSRNINVEVIKQPFATNVRNVVSNFYNYKGIGALSPEYEVAYDFTTNPNPITFDITSFFEDFVDNLQEFMPLTDVVTDSTWDGETNPFGRQGGTLEFEDTVSTLVIDSKDQPVGDLISNIEFNPFIEEREIKVWMGGLRPNTRHYFFFDQVDVNTHVAPGTAADIANDVEKFGEYGDSVLTDENGVLRAIFKVPEATFFVGDRTLDIYDVSTFDDIGNAATSGGYLTYRAYNFTIEKTEISTREPDFNLDQEIVPNSVTFPRRGDPLAQTFFLRSSMGEGADSIMVSEIDIFFKRKPENTPLNGITLYLSETDNGYPSGNIIPFSKVHLRADQVNVSDDSSVATTFTFAAPVRLLTEKEYAFMLMPDANDPNYLVHIMQVGGLDKTPGPTNGQAIVQDWGDGALFTSTNNRAWKSEQDQDVKFTLYRHNFNASSGRLTLTTNDPEFLTVNDFTGRFKNDEFIYQIKDLGLGTSNTISMSTGNNVITGIGFDTTYAPEDYILVSNGTNTDIFRITDVTSGSRMTVNKNTPFDVSSGSGQPIVAGKLSYYDYRYPDEMYLERSNARVGRVFDTGQTIYGLESGSTANTVSIDNIQLSYIQTFIHRTNDSATRTNIDGTFVSPNNLNATYNIPMRFNDNTYFAKEGVILYSKTNDLGNSKKFEINVNLENNQFSATSPFIDIEISKIFAYQWKITNSPDTTSKFISKRVELVESFDAEDFQLILSAYRPPNTEIKAYIRPQNVYDSDDFENIDWIELELFEGINSYSSITNPDDFREFKYRVLESRKDANGILAYTSNAGDFSGYRRFAVRIDMLSENIYNAPTLRDYRGIALT